MNRRFPWLARYCVLLLLLSWTARGVLALSIAVPTTASSSSSVKKDASRDTSGSSIHVWDDVLSTRTCSVLHETACQLGLGHRVFSRRITTDDGQRQQNNNNNNPVEQALDSILHQLGDKSPFVEYWTRQEWRSIHAHADVDEYLAKQQHKQLLQKEVPQPFRYPMQGHVLYLQTGTDVKGPTCVFPGRRSGGELLLSLSNGKEKKDTDTKDGDGDDAVELVTIPAVPGRLLRFQGDFLHTVPRPTELWLLNFVQGSPDFQPESRWGRSVILFNTWDNEPPLGVPTDEATATTTATSDRLSGEEEGAVRCNGVDQWEVAFPSTEERQPEKTLHASSETNDEDVPVKIWLLGDYHRRGHPMQTVKLRGNEDTLQRALYEESTVSTVHLRHSP